MRTEEEIKEMIKKLKKNMKNSFPCDDINWKSREAISVLRWVLQEKKKIW